MHAKVKEIETLVEFLEKVEAEDSNVEDQKKGWMDYICDQVMTLDSINYRKKIKGFHLAFNVKAKLEDGSAYKY